VILVLVIGVALLVAVLLRGEGSWQGPLRAGARPELGC
jgi:hypothetical protein